MDKNDHLITGIEGEDGYIIFPSESGENSRGCKISKSALRELAGEPAKELNFPKIFEEFKNEILKRAREMIRQGNKNPIIRNL